MRLVKKIFNDNLHKCPMLCMNHECQMHVKYVSKISSHVSAKNFRAESTKITANKNTSGNI